MPLLNPIHESLPYIDTEPTPSERQAALALITAELSPSASTEPHPLLPPPPPENFSPLIEAELLRVSKGEPLKAIDLSRYESIDPPSAPPTTPETTLLWKAALQKAYTSQTYLSSRLISLSLLEKYGKNAWLISNSQLEAMLKTIEKELEDKKTEIDNVVIERRNAQEAVGGEIKGLEEGWKRGVGRVLETEVAAEGVRGRILERRREGAF